MAARIIALITGSLFIAIGLIGFTDNPFFGASPDALFHSDVMQNAIYIGSGALFIFLAVIAPEAISTFLIMLACIYLLIAILGFIDIGTGGNGNVLGFLQMNEYGNVLYLALGLFMLISGIRIRKKATVTYY